MIMYLKHKKILIYQNYSEFCFNFISCNHPPALFPVPMCAQNERKYDAHAFLKACLLQPTQLIHRLQSSTAPVFSCSSCLASFSKYASNKSKDIPLLLPLQIPPPHSLRPLCF